MSAGLAIKNIEIVKKIAEIDKDIRTLEYVSSRLSIPFVNKREEGRRVQPQGQRRIVVPQDRIQSQGQRRIVVPQDRIQSQGQRRVVTQQSQGQRRTVSPAQPQEQRRAVIPQESVQPQYQRIVLEPEEQETDTREDNNKFKWYQFIKKFKARKEQEPDTRNGNTKPKWYQFIKRFKVKRAEKRTEKAKKFVDSNKGLYDVAFQEKQERYNNGKREFRESIQYDVELEKAVKNKQSQEKKNELTQERDKHKKQADKYTR